MQFNEANEYYLVKGWFDKSGGMKGNKFYGVVAPAENPLALKRVVIAGDDAKLASEAAQKQPAQVYPHEINEDSDGQYRDALTPKERSDTQRLLLDDECELQDDGGYSPEEIKAYLAKGHGVFYGSCGHLDHQCRCMHPQGKRCPTFKMNRLCSQCSPIKEMLGTAAIAINPSVLGMPDRGGHGHIDNLGPKRVRVGRNCKMPKNSGLKGIGGSNKLLRISQTGGCRGGNKH